MNELVIANTSIRQDADGRYCLNDLHKAAGSNPKHKPSEWLRNKQTLELIEEVEIAGIPAIQSKQQVGTFVVKELVYAYAMWISAKFHLQVIRAYEALVTGKLQPPSTPALPFTTIKDEFEAVLGIAHLIGIKGNQGLLSASGAIQKRYGVNLLQVLDAPDLVSAVQEKYHTPTELGARLNVGARRFNIMLEAAGMQKSQINSKNEKFWVLTEKGLDYGIYIDTGKRHATGAPVQQIKWYESVLDIIPTIA